MPISSELFSALEKGGGLAVEKTPSADKPAPQGGGSTFDRLLRQESGGRQTDKNGNVITSSKGAIGIAQVMPATGPEAAKLAGMEWDPVRFKSDAEYNKALGRAYFDKQLSVFGDERLALAAYNAGPGAVRLAIARSAKNGGDPLEYLPLETQKYVPAILGADAGAKPKWPKWADDKAIVRDDGRPGAIAKSDAVRAGPTAGDMAKAFGASALSGVGDMGQGLIGEPLAWLANKAAGTEEFEGQNLLAGVAESIRDDMTEGGKIARQDVPSGDVFQPETWKLPETTGGMLMIGADGLGSLVPSILPFVGQASKAANLAKAAQAAKVAGDFEKASQLAIQAERASRVAKGAGAVGGFAMTGGAAAGEVRQNIERELQGKSHEELLQNVPLYREAFDKTGDARMARQAVANGAAQYATLFAGAMGAVGGGINAKLLEDVIVKRGLSAALGKMSGNAAVRAGVGAGAGAVGEGLQEVSEKMGQNAGENVGMGRPIADNVTRDSFGDFIGGAMIGGPMGGVGGGASLQVKQPVQPVIKQNSPLSNMASVGQAAQANAEQDGAAVPGVNTPAQDPTADRLAAMQSFVEDKAFIQALRGTEGYGPESVTELLSAYAKARNPNIDPRLREMALSDLEKFVETFNNRPNFVFGKNTQEPTPQPGQSVAPYQQQGGAVGPTIRRPDGRTLDGEIITRPEGMAGANPNQLKAPPVLGLPTEEALQAKRQADADYEQAYQDLVKAEQLGANEAEIADYQRALLEAERLRDELAAQLADSDARVADSQQREAEARRRDILGSVIEQGISGVNPVADVAGRFSAELMRQGYRDTAPTDAETQSILRAVDVANAREDGPLPSLPNEGEFYAPPKAQRTAPPKAESKPKQQPNRRLTPKEIREYVAAGAILNGDTLTLPDGTVLKLKGPQIAAAREAMRKVAPAQVESAPAQANETEVSPQDSAPQQVESPAAVSENPAETPDVSTRADDQLRYLANNGKPGWKEAAQAEMARREGAKPAPASDLAGEKIDSEWTAFAPETGTLGIPRDDMPQIKAEHRGAMTNFMNARGVEHRAEEVPADSLRPTQAEFSPEKVKKAMEFDGGDRSILVSNDDYVLDGHHQWLAKRESGDEIKVIRLDAPISELVPLALEFPSSTTAGDEKPEAPATEASDTATEQPDPRESYADEKERAYVAKRGGVVPPKAAMAVRIGAYREYDRNQAAQPTHQDPGQPSEPVTPAVVAKSIQKSARNTEFNPAEAKKWLLGEIDKAVANVPAENTELAAELAREKAKTFDPQGRSSAEQKEFYALRDSNVTKIAKQIGFVTFDVPGDGKFKVLNTVDGLNAFRSKVDKSSGFKAPANKPPVMERETDTGSYTPRDALADGEFLNAYELARLQGKPLRFSVGSGRPNAYTDASDVKGLIPGFKTFVGRKADSSKMPWAVIEESTGLAIGDGGTSKAAAIAAAKAKMKGHEQAIADKLKRGGISDAKLQDQLEADWIKWAEEREGRKLEDAEDDVPSVANFKTAKLLDAWLAENVSDPYQLETETPDGTLKDQGVGHLTLEKKTRLVHRVTKSQRVNDDDVSNVFKLKDGRLVWWNDATGDVLPVSPIDPRYSTNERYSKFIDRYMAERAEPAAKPMPNPLNMTPKQYFEARMQWIADDYGMSLPEVRESYDNDGFRDETDSDWIKAVSQAFKDGTELTRATLDKLEELRPGAFLSNLHDYPDANVPDGYQTPSARKAEKEDADAKRETRSEVAQPSDLANIFAGLSSRGLAKTRAQKAAQAHQRAEQIAYVQDNFLDILTELEDSGIVKINCD